MTKASVDPNLWFDKIKLEEEESLLFGVGQMDPKIHDDPDICPFDKLPVDPTKGWLIHVKSYLPDQSTGVVVIDFERTYHLSHFHNDMDGGPWDNVA